CSCIERARSLPGNSEFVLPQARRNIRMRFRGDVWVHAEGDRCLSLKISSSLREQLELAFALDVKSQDPSAKRQIYFLCRLSYTRKNDPSHRLRSGGSHPLELATRNYVKACPELRQEHEQREIGVCFYGIAEGVWDSPKGAVKDLEALRDL